MTTGTRIFLWEAGAHSGTAGTWERALEIAGEFLGDGEGLVEEAALATAADGDMVQAHQRTGTAWRGRLLDGRPSWRRCPPGPA